MTDRISLETLPFEDHGNHQKGEKQSPWDISMEVSDSSLAGAHFSAWQQNY